VIAFDFSDHMLAQARRRVSSDRVHFFEHDVSNPWPIPDQSADLVLDSLVLEHVADLGVVFPQARRVLKPGGSLFVCELHPFRQISGAQAHFGDPSTGSPVHVPAVRHDVSDFVNSGVAAGLSLVCSGEWRNSGATSDVVPILLSVTFLRQ
jgi:SAM-dependent methyltransferase